MFSRAQEPARSVRFRLAALSALAFVAGLATLLFVREARAQNVTVNNNTGGSGLNNAAFVGRAVGGVSIDPNGVLQNATQDDLGTLGQLRRQALEKVPAELGQAVELRKVSLRRLEAAILESRQPGKGLSDAITHLAGLQRIHYVFVYPEQRDIVLVGPGEGWKADARGNVVGATTGRPVMLLDDLLVALRSARQAAQGGISCSIDPTPEGMQRYQELARTVHNANNLEVTLAAMEKAIGPQQITITGVPSDSHFARVLLAADYRMKRLGMNFDQAPVRGLPSYLHMVKAGAAISTPRWWLEPKYEPIVHDAEGLAWELRGASVKTMTEEDFFAANGSKQRTGKPMPMAQKWADLMTQKYDELAVAEPIFGELQNCMELAIVAALVVKEQLPEKAGYNMSTLLDPSGVKTAAFAAPKTVDTKTSAVRKGNNWIISASGGVLVNSWAIADKTEKSDAPAKVRSQAAPHDKANWWWN